MKKKLLILFAAVTLGISVTGCGGKKPESSGAPAKGSSSPVNTAQATGSGSGGAKPELRMLVPFEQIDHNKDVVAQYLKDKTGYPVKYEQLPAEESDQKLNLLMANKEAYDIMKISGQQFYQLATEGALEPLDDLIAQYGKNMKEVISPQSWEGTKINGNTYAIPEIGPGVFVGTELAVRQDWMDELGLQMPTTRDELYTVLKTIKEKKNVIPLTGYEGVSPLIASTFGITNNWMEADGKMIHAVEHPRMKEYLAFMNKLYKEGLIDSEWPLNKEATKAMEKFASGKAAMYTMAWWDAPGLTDALKKNFPNAKIGLVPYLKDDSGKAVVGVIGGISSYIVIPKFAKHKEEAMQYMDLKLSPEIFKGMTIGEEGVHYEVKDGKYYPINPKFSDERNSASWFTTGVDEKNYPLYWQARVRKNPIIQEYFEKIQANAAGLTVLDPISYAPPLPGVSKNLQKTYTYMNDSFIKFITNADSVDNYDKFLAQWRSDGGDEMIKDANEWYKNSKK